jgi:hypothetical protein
LKGQQKSEVYFDEIDALTPEKFHDCVLLEFRVHEESSVV